MDSKTVEAYNLFAEKYDEETVSFWERFPRVVFDKFIEEVHGKVLDVGSGPGRDGLILTQSGLDVVCLDASEKMIKLSSAKGLDSVLGDFNNLPFEDGFFQGVWAYTSLLYVPKKDVARPLEEINRVLQPRGILGLGLIEGNTEEYKESSKIPTPRLFAYYSKTEVEDLLHNNGFEIIYFETFKPDTRNYLNFIARKR